MHQPTDQPPPHSVGDAHDEPCWLSEAWAEVKISDGTQHQFGHKNDHRCTQPPPATVCASKGDAYGEPCWLSEAWAEVKTSDGTQQPQPHTEQGPSSPVSTLTTQLQPQPLEQGGSGEGGGGSDGASASGTDAGGADGADCGG